MNVNEIVQQIERTPFQVVERVVQQKIYGFHLDNKNAKMEPLSSVLLELETTHINGTKAFS